jgi:hypothetical protein
MVKYLDCGDVKLPYKFARALIIEFKSITGKDIVKDAENLDVEDNMKFCFLALKYGHIAEKKEFSMTWDQFLELDTIYDVVEVMTKEIAEGAGK